jgi:hypothetical protein
MYTYTVEVKRETGGLMKDRRPELKPVGKPFQVRGKNPDRAQEEVRRLLTEREIDPSAVRAISFAPENKIFVYLSIKPKAKELQGMVYKAPRE